MFFMAYSPQPTVAVDTSYWSGNARLDLEKGRRALRRRPCPAIAGSRTGSIAFHSAFISSTEKLVDAIVRGAIGIVLWLRRVNFGLEKASEALNRRDGEGRTPTWELDAPVSSDTSTQCPSEETTRYSCPGEAAAAVRPRRPCIALGVSLTNAALGLPG